MVRRCVLLGFLLSTQSLLAGRVTASRDKAIEALKRSGQFDALRSAFGRARRTIERHGNVYGAENPENRLQIDFGPLGPEITHPRGRFCMRLESLARDDEIRTPAAPTIQAAGTRVVYHRGALAEWYSNEAQGLEQGFTITERPSGTGLLTLVLNVSGELMPVVSGNDVQFQKNGVSVLN